MEFGKLGVTVRGVVTYRISPYEQKAFAQPMALISNYGRRVYDNLWHAPPLFILSWFIYDQTEKGYKQWQRKQPGQFDNETFD